MGNEMIDTEQERRLQARFEQLRAELAVPACNRCKGCKRVNNHTVTNPDHGQSTTAAAK